MFINDFYFSSLTIFYEIFFPRNWNKIFIFSFFSLRFLQLKCAAQHKKIIIKETKLIMFTFLKSLSFPHLLLTTDEDWLSGWRRMRQNVIQCASEACETPKATDGKHWEIEAFIIIIDKNSLLRCAFEIYLGENNRKFLRCIIWAKLEALGTFPWEFSGFPAMLYFR